MPYTARGLVKLDVKFILIRRYELGTPIISVLVKEKNLKTFHHIAPAIFFGINSQAISRLILCQESLNIKSMAFHQ